MSLSLLRKLAVPGVISAVCLLLAQTTANAQAAPRVHAVFIGDTTSNIRKWCYEDVVLMRDLVTANLSEKELCCSFVMMDHERALTPERLIRQIENFTVGPNDTVLYYYSGHGGYNERDGQFLALPEGGRVRRSQVRDAIRKKSPRLGVLITDCCYSYSPSQPPPATAPAPAAPIPATRPLLQKLLLESEGFVDITSSSPDEVSLCMRLDETGGMFTHALLAVLNREMNQRLSWKDVFLETKHETMAAFKKVLPKGLPDRNQLSQRPFAFVLDKPRLGCYAQPNGGNGVQVSGVVEMSPAQSAGLMQGDVILEINGENVSDVERFYGWVSSSENAAELLVKRGRTGVTEQLNVRLW